MALRLCLINIKPSIRPLITDKNENKIDIMYNYGRMINGELGDLGDLDKDDDRVKLPSSDEKQETTIDIVVDK